MPLSGKVVRMADLRSPARSWSLPGLPVSSGYRLPRARI